MKIIVRKFDAANCIKIVNYDKMAAVWRLTVLNFEMLYNFRYEFLIPNPILDSIKHFLTSIMIYWNDFEFGIEFEMYHAKHNAANFQ